MVELAVGGETGSAGFSGYAELREAHSQFSKRYAAARSGVGSTGDGGDGIHAFVDKAKEAGAFIVREDERRAAQTILDYWSAELINASSGSGKDWSPAVLAPPMDDQDRFRDPDARDISPELAERRRRARDQIRLSAVVRRWRDSGESSDYLLSGAALRDAENHMDLDPEIKALVLKSRESERRKSTYRWVGLTTAVAILSVLCVALWFMWRQANDDKIIAETQTGIAKQQEQRALEQQKRAETLKAAAEVQKREAENQKELAEKLRAAAESQKIEADRQRERAEEKTIETSKAFESSQARVRELENAQTQLDAALRVIGEAIRTGVLAESDIPPELLSSLENVARSHYRFPTDALRQMTGYNPDFLGVPVRRPSLPNGLESHTLNDGTPLPYVNYSLVFDTLRRSAVYTASNLDRSQLLVLPRVAGTIVKDPRIPDALQPLSADPRVYPALETSLLAANEIAWGPFFEGREYEAAEKLASVTRVFPNVVPEEAGIDRQTWAALERWILTEHNISATKVSIFTGTVPAADDPVISGVSIPRQYWKVAVSREPVTRISESLNALRVDAFVIKAGRGPASGAKGAPFNPQPYRVSIGDIEGLTGLTFDDRIRDAAARGHASAQDGESEAKMLAAQVNLLNAAQSSTRTDVTQQIVNAVGPKGLSLTDQREVIAALLDQLDRTVVQDLTTTGLYNFLFSLSQVPAFTWEQPGWKPLRDRALQTVRDLEQLARSSKIHIAPKTRENLSEWEVNLGGEVGNQETIYFQFAGMTREKALEVSFGLRDLGWKIPGEERTAAAAGRNEIRYGAEDDKPTAEFLATDLKTMWPNEACCKTVRNAKIQKGVIEVWISQ